ncbi:type 2C protein phosphatase [Saccharomycopsis crataegensis]|uniref:Protein phosphatase n=1 Tax=Saccharomycopsis crataegensis TaxID=43959 RepID=A0AAV5QTC0_9ASCO|nr:type 2C protein phosphatase [Saccharomycopsis crataegensis]
MNFYVLYWYFLIITSCHFMLLASRNTAPVSRALRSSIGRHFFATTKPATRRHFTSSSSSSFDGSAAGFKYNVAVAYAPKLRSEELDPAKYPAGEDSFIHGARQSDGNLVLGVADGVGGWSEVKGCSSADMSNVLCGLVSKLFKGQEVGGDNTKDLLARAYKDMKLAKVVKAGGTTICYGVLNSQTANLEVLNLGDSWCGVFRDFKCVEQTKFQTLGFNTPKQLSIIPKDLQEKAAREGRRYITNTPSDADVYNFQLQKNDIVVFATDGVTDNVYPEDLEMFLKDSYDSQVDNKDVDLQKVTDSLVNGVRVLSQNPKFPSPFSQEMSRVYGQKYYGGKADDITVVILKVD